MDIINKVQVTKVVSFYGEILGIIIGVPLDSILGPLLLYNRKCSANQIFQIIQMPPPRIIVGTRFGKPYQPKNNNR